MSTNPHDQSALFWRPTPAPPVVPKAKPREPLWTLTKDGVEYAAALVGFGEWGWACELTRDGEFLYSRRHALHELAAAEGAALRDEITAHGWTKD